jgi:cytidine deaminase
METKTKSHSNAVRVSQKTRKPVHRGRSKQDAASLIAAAAHARRGAVAPYSKFEVGAALLTASGEVITGANVESASYGLTCCAERVALFKALTSGKRQFVAVAVVARVAGGPAPCGACRQLLIEYAPDAMVYVADSRALGAVRAFKVRDLMPMAFVEVPEHSV